MQNHLDHFRPGADRFQNVKSERRVGLFFIPDNSWNILCGVLPMNKKEGENGDFFGAVFFKRVDGMGDIGLSAVEKGVADKAIRGLGPHFGNEGNEFLVGFFSR